MKLFFIFFLILMTSYGSSLKEHWLSNEKNLQGAFIVTKSSQNISVLRIHSINLPYVILEEVSAPYETTHTLFPSYKQWLEGGCLHHTSWVMYQLDLSKNKIIGCYSIAQKAFLSSGHESSLITNLLGLNLDQIVDSERKKIGVKPQDAEIDSRKIWNPPIVVDGIKKKSSKCTAMRSYWPSDSSELAGRCIELYFDSEAPSFPFPYWIEIGDGYNCMKLPVIDSGFVKQSHLASFPKMTPEILAVSLKEGDLLVEIEGQDLEGYQLILLETEKGSYQSHLAPYIFIKEKKTAQVSAHHLCKILTNGKRYRLALISEDDPSCYIESDKSFVYHRK